MGRRRAEVVELPLERSDGAVPSSERDSRRARAPWPPAARTLVAVVAALVVLGIVMVLMTSAASGSSPWHLALRQGLWAAIGALAFGGVQLVGIDRLRTLSTAVLAVALALLALVLLPGVGTRVDGSSRWIGIGFLTVQPSELAKLAVLLFSADLLARRGDRLQDWRVALRPLVVVTGLLAGLILLQPDLGTTIVLVGIAFGVAFAAGIDRRQLAVVGVAGAVGAFVVAWAAPYRRARLLSFLHPWLHHSGSGYQIAESLAGLSSGHLLGTGLQGGLASWGFLPNASTDFIFAVIGEDLGALGAIAVLGAFALVVLVGLRIARRETDPYRRLLAVGAAAWIGVAVVVNVGAVTGALPVTGVPLPFVSYGGSSLVVDLVVAGVLVRLARDADRRRSTSAGKVR